MRKKIDRRPITPEETEVLRQVISVAPWKHSTAEEYKDCPHSYIVRHAISKEWDYFANLIKICGEIREWHAPWGKTCFYRYLIIDEKCYWAMWPIINCANASTLEPRPAV